jgi:hypothetical protein
VRNGLQSGGTVAVDGLTGDRIRQTGPQGDHAGHIKALLALGECAADDDVVDFSRIQNFHPVEQITDHCRSHFIRPGSDQAATLGFANGCPGGGDDDGVSGFFNIL